MSKADQFLGRIATIKPADGVALIESDEPAYFLLTEILSRCLTKNNIDLIPKLRDDLVEFFVIMYSLGYQRGKMVKLLGKIYAEEEQDELA